VRGSGEKPAIQVSLEKIEVAAMLGTVGRGPTKRVSTKPSRCPLVLAR
jgi:hypothetical protein